MIRNIIFLFFIFINLICLVNCNGDKDEPSDKNIKSPGPIQGGTLEVALWVAFPTMDWHSSVSHPLPQCLLHVYEGLFGFGKDFSPVPELADTWFVSKDKLTWTFGIRRGVLFHNGKELSAEDVKASIERWRRISPRGVMLKDLRTIDIVDKYTVQFHFNKPIGRFLLLILAGDESKAVIMPKEVADKSPQGGALSQIIGTGPYRFTEHRIEEYVRLKRFEGYVPRTDSTNYHGGKKEAYPDEIIFWIVPESSTRVAGLERGEYDIITRLPDSEYERLNANPEIEPIINAPAVLDYLIFNHKKGLFTDINMRKAIQSLVDVKQVNQSIVSSEAFWTLNPSIYPPESAYNNNEASEFFNQANPEKAKDYLVKAGYNNEPVKFLVLREEPEIYRASITISEQMKAAGINVDLLIYDVATWVAKRANPDEMDLFITKGYWIDPSLFHAEFGGRFPGWFKSEETEQVFNLLALETEFEKRFQLGKKLQRLFYEKVAFINVGYHYGGKARRTSVHDPEENLTRGNLTLHNVWIDK